MLLLKLGIHSTRYCKSLLISAGLVQKKILAEDIQHILLLLLFPKLFCLLCLLVCSEGLTAAREASTHLLVCNILVAQPVSARGIFFTTRSYSYSIFDARKRRSDLIIVLGESSAKQAYRSQKN